jgi:hypothetical protein
MTTRRLSPLGWSRQERAALRRLSTPRRIQDLLDQFAYRTEDAPASPRRALAERRVHCFDGALLAAAALRFHGVPPLLLDLRAVRDDDHVLAVFRVRGGWGAIAKSNFVGLRYREPIHRTLRELALSYFEPYYNLRRQRTLREYSARPLDLRRFDRQRWEFDEAVGPGIAARLDGAPHRPLLAPAQEGRLTLLDPRSLRAGMVGTDLAGVRRG